MLLNDLAAGSRQGLVIHYGGIAQGELEIAVRTVSRADAAGKLLHQLGEPLPGLLAEGSGGTGDGHLTGDDIIRLSGMDHAHGHHGRLHRLDTPGNQGLQGSHDLTGDDDGVHTGLRERGVTALADDPDIETVRGAGEGPGPDTEGARREV